MTSVKPHLLWCGSIREAKKVNGLRRFSFHPTGGSMSLRKHIRECAEEMGIDWPIPTSHERKLRYRGRTIEVYYTEDGSLYAWKAFVMGLGESSGINEAEAIDGAKRRIDKANPIAGA